MWGKRESHGTCKLDARLPARASLAELQVWLMREYLVLRWRTLSGRDFPVCACMHANLLQSCLFQSYGLQSARLLCPWDSSGMNTGVGCHALLQGIFLTQGSNPCVLRLLHWHMGSSPLMPPGKPGDTSVLIKPNFLSLLDTQLDNMSQPPWYFGRTIWLAEWHIWHF